MFGWNSPTSPSRRLILSGVLGAAFAPGTLLAALKTDPASDFKQLLKRPVCPLAPNLSRETREGVLHLSGSFESEPGERVPVLAMSSASRAGRRPAVLVLHGTGGNKEQMLPTLEELSRRGFFAIAIDGRHFGARAPGARGSEAYQDAILQAWHEKNPARQRHPFFYDTVYDVWRTVDFLQSLPEVDPDRIGCIGFSKGGIETWMAAACDPRIRVAVPAIAVQSFRWSLENDRWQGRAGTVRRAHEVVASELGEPGINQKVCRALWTKILPGVLDEFDGPSMVPLISPRPLLILSGEKDPNCPLPGAELAFATTRTAYAAHKERLDIDVAAGVGHLVTPEQRQKAMAWFERWLKP